MRPIILVLMVGVALSVVLAGDAAVGIEQQTPGTTKSAAWNEIKWPFPLDQWGVGRAFRCRAADCGADIELYLRPKLGFCNCTTGVSDDAELDRVGDLELLSGKFEGLRDGRPISIGWMSGRSRPYRVAIPHGAPRTAFAVAFNDKCDVVVATVVADAIPAAERAALVFLGGEEMLRWVQRELGL